MVAQPSTGSQMSLSASTWESLPLRRSLSLHTSPRRYSCSYTLLSLSSQSAVALLYGSLPELVQLLLVADTASLSFSVSDNTQIQSVSGSVCFQLDKLL